MVIVDRQRKIDIFCLLHTIDSAQSVATIFIEKLVKSHGLAKIVLFNREVKFKSNLEFIHRTHVDEIVKGPALHVIWLCMPKFIFILIDKINHFYWLLMPIYIIGY